MSRGQIKQIYIKEFSLYFIISKYTEISICPFLFYHYYHLTYATITLLHLTLFNHLNDVNENIQIQNKCDLGNDPSTFWKYSNNCSQNKEKLRDLIAATGLVILLKMKKQNQWFFSLYDLEIRWMALKNNRAPLLVYTKLCALFQSHHLIKSGVIIRSPSIQVKISNFLSYATLKFDGWLWKTIEHPFYASSSFVNNFIADS